MAAVPDRTKIRVLIVEPAFRAAKDIEASLIEAGLLQSSVVRASDLHAAVDHLRTDRFSICLVNAELGDGHTVFDFIDRIIKMAAPPPYIVMSDTDDVELDEECQRRGAAHFLVKKQVSASQLERLIRYVVGHYQRETDLVHAATFDKLTGLLGRRAFVERTTRAIHRAARTQNPVCIACIDLQKFEGINDIHGHSRGDAVMAAVAHRLKTRIRKTDTAARFGSDEFGCLLEDFGDEDNATEILKKLLLGFKAPVRVDGQDYTVSAAIGVAFHPRDGEEADTVLHRADAALNKARVAAVESGKPEMIVAGS